MIDWNRLWAEARARRTWQARTKRDWNERAAGFAKRHIGSVYVREFVKRLSLTPETTVLDMGAGPGSLALPLASQVKSVTAVDFSPEMLEILKKRAVESGVDNITVLEGSWEDDWLELGIMPHDLVIASRSLAVDDLRGALEKLHATARHRVVIGDRVGSGPFDPAIFAAIGREFEPGPDYIYTVNILYQMGISAKVDFIDLPPGQACDTKQEVINSCRWMFSNLTAGENEKLTRHIGDRLRQNEHGQWVLTDEVCPRWAIISWAKG